MAYSYNKVTLVGRLGSDPELSSISNGTMVAKTNLATSERYQDKQTSEWKEQTQWHRLVFWDRMAETASKYLKKGAQVFIEGKIKYGQYTGNDGITRYTTDITVTEMVMLGDKNSATSNEPQVAPSSQSFNNTGTVSPESTANTVADLLAKNLTPDIEDDDIPF